MARPRVIAVAVYVLALAAFAAFVVVPFLDKKRDIPAEVPSPAPLNSTGLVLLQPGSVLCMKQAAMSAESRQVRFKVGTYARPGPPLGVSVKGPGYASQTRIAAGFADNSTLAANVGAPGRSRLVTVCVRNLGRVKIALYASPEDRTHSRVSTYVDGKYQNPTPTLIFAERRPVSFDDRAGVTAGRIAVFRGFLGHSWVVWLLALAMLAGVPVLVAAGILAARDQPRTDSSAE
jgi:hypothetical protein